jgi:hypothetical protein
VAVESATMPDTQAGVNHAAMAARAAASGVHAAMAGVAAMSGQSGA